MYPKNGLSKPTPNFTKPDFPILTEQEATSLPDSGRIVWFIIFSNRFEQSTLWTFEKEIWTILHISSGRPNLGGLDLSVYRTLGSSKHATSSKHKRKSNWTLVKIISLNDYPELSTPPPPPSPFLVALILNWTSWNMPHGQLCLMSSNCYSHRSIKMEKTTTSFVHPQSSYGMSGSCHNGGVALLFLINAL